MNRLLKCLSLNLALCALTACTGGFEVTKPTSPAAPIVTTPTSVVVTVHIVGDGSVAILDQDGLCTSSADCPVTVVQNNETEFQAVYDESSGLQLVSFTGCDSLSAGGTICRIAPARDVTITALFSKPPVANFIYYDDGETVYISLFDEDGEALTYDPDGPMPSIEFVTSNGSTVTCTVGGDLSMPAAQSNCLRGDSDYIFAFAADPSVLDLSVTLNATDDVGLKSSLEEQIRAQ